MKMHIDVLDDILYADDKDKGNDEEYQLIGMVQQIHMDYL